MTLLWVGFVVGVVLIVYALISYLKFDSHRGEATTLKLPGGTEISAKSSSALAFCLGAAILIIAMLNFKEPTPPAPTKISDIQAVWAKTCNAPGVNVTGDFTSCNGKNQCDVIFDDFGWRKYNGGADPCYHVFKPVTVYWKCNWEGRQKDFRSEDYGGKYLRISCE